MQNFTTIQYGADVYCMELTAVPTRTNELLRTVKSECFRQIRAIQNEQVKILRYPSLAERESRWLSSWKTRSESRDCPTLWGKQVSLFVTSSFYSCLRAILDRESRNTIFGDFII